MPVQFALRRYCPEPATTSHLLGASEQLFGPATPWQRPPRAPGGQANGAGARPRQTGRNGKTNGQPRPMGGATQSTCGATTSTDAGARQAEPGSNARDVAGEAGRSRGERRH